MDEKRDFGLADLLLMAAIAGTKKEKENAKATETIYTRETAKKLGERLYQTVLGFQDAGFTTEQAFELALTILKI